MFLIHIAKCGPLPMLCAVISFPHVQGGSTPLYAACEGGHKQIVIVLLESGANVNLTTVSSLSGTYSELSSWLQHLFVCMQYLCYPHHCCNISHWSRSPFTISPSMTQFTGNLANVSFVK